MKGVLDKYIGEGVARHPSLCNNRENNLHTTKKTLSPNVKNTPKHLCISLKITIFVVDDKG